MPPLLRARTRSLTRLRAALLRTITLGVTAGHQLLELDELREVPREESARVLPSVLRALTDRDVS
ncbi:hypothetical protein [Nonomuraea sp. NPDC048916]|uniref:hypothetical protein n=1 Tax=Nonomuraea sp. NPDC048916 TaxID=3154232 RepID=UPI0033D2EC92